MLKKHFKPVSLLFSFSKLTLSLWCVTVKCKSNLVLGFRVHIPIQEFIKKINTFREKKIKKNWRFVQNNLHQYHISILVCFTCPSVPFMLILFHLIKSDTQLTGSCHGRMPLSFALVKEIQLLLKSFEFKVHKLKISKKTSARENLAFCQLFILKYVPAHSSNVVSKYSFKV